jgi:asparagine synthase (glutamine-hydrolysing)
VCGVIGVSLASGASGEAADRLAVAGIRRLLHRGPDGYGVVGDAGSAVAMCRLRVRSRPEDRVPFAQPAPAGPATAGGMPHARPADPAEAFAYNGEVYAVTGADGGWWVPPGGLGEATAVRDHRPERVDGMYAMVHRTADGALHVARDPLGIKPLYLRRHPRGVAVASEVTALLDVFDRPRVRPEAVAQFLLLGRVVDGGTFFEGIELVRPGERVELRAGRITSRRVAARPAAADRPVGPEELRAAVRDAVERVLVADRPLGLALSGGLDSTVVGFELARLGVPDLATVSVLPESSGDGVAALDALGLPGAAWRTWCHRWMPFGPDDLLDGVPDTVAALGEPTAMTSVPMYAALARLARQSGAVVLLLGEGADELFGGYRSYLRLAGLARPIDFYLSPARREMACWLLGGDAAEAAEDALVSALPAAGGRHAAAVVQEFEREHSLEPLLRRADHLLMAQGIEGRTPFLHGDLPELAAALPMDALVREGQTKVPLRQSFATELPHFLHEVKRPFRAPIDTWLTGAVRDRVRGDLVADTGRLATVGVRPDGVAELRQRLAAGRADGDLVFAVLTLAAWLAWLSGHPRTAATPSLSGLPT